MTTTSDAQPDLTHPEPTSRRRFRPWQWLIGLLLVAGGAGLVWYYDFGTPAARPGQFGGGGGGGRGPGGPGGPGGRRPDEKPPVRVVTAEKRNIGVALKALGTVTPINTVTVRSRLDGELVRVHFTEGQRVREGQLLAEIDARPYEVALAQAQGNKAENDARLNNARADFATYQSLFERQLIPKQQLTAQESLVKQVEGTVQSNDAQVNNAKLQLSYTRIVAPISGRLGLRQVDVGNLVRSGDANGIVVITQMQPISVLFTVPETDLPVVLEAMRRDRRLAVQAWDRAETTQLATGDAADGRQPDRHDDRHHPPACRLRQRRRQAVPEPVRQHRAQPVDAARRDRRAVGDDPARVVRHLRVRDHRRQQGDGAARDARPGTRANAWPSPKGSARATASCSRASTRCARALSWK